MCRYLYEKRQVPEILREIQHAKRSAWRDRHFLKSIFGSAEILVGHSDRSGRRISFRASISSSARSSHVVVDVVENRFPLSLILLLHPLSRVCSFFSSLAFTAFSFSFFFFLVPACARLYVFSCWLFDSFLRWDFFLAPESWVHLRDPAFKFTYDGSAFQFFSPFFLVPFLLHIRTSRKNGLGFLLRVSMNFRRQPFTFGAICILKQTRTWEEKNVDLEIREK